MGVVAVDDATDQIGARAEVEKRRKHLDVEVWLSCARAGKVRSHSPDQTPEIAPEVLGRHAQAETLDARAQAPAKALGRRVEAAIRRLVTVHELRGHRRAPEDV